MDVFSYFLYTFSLCHASSNQSLLLKAFLSLLFKGMMVISRHYADTTCLRLWRGNVSWLYEIIVCPILYLLKFLFVGQKYVCNIFRVLVFFLNHGSWLEDLFLIALPFMQIEKFLNYELCHKAKLYLVSPYISILNGGSRSFAYSHLGTYISKLFNFNVL